MSRVVKRKATWGQENPRDELCVILGAIEGDLCNMERGIINDRQVPRMMRLLRDCQELAAGLEPGEFDTDVVYPREKLEPGQ